MGTAGEGKPTREFERNSQLLDLVLRTAGNINAARVDSDLRHTWVYNSASEPPASEILGKRDDELFPPEDAEPTMQLKRRVLETGEPVADEFAFHKPWGDNYYEAAAEPIFADSGEVEEVAFAAVDVTEQVELKQREAALRRQNERLEEFASLVSHDLQNPLTVAKGRVHLARQRDDTENLRKLEAALDRMGALIEDVLALARQGAYIEDPTAVSLASVAEDAWETTATEDGTLTVEADATIRADERRLHQLFENLFGNAIRHSRSDAHVRVDLLDDGFYVEDDGPGIPAADRETVFDSGYSTSTDGMGFGLAIVQNIAHAHGWTIDVTDGTDGGARFEITNAPTLDAP